MHFSEQIKMHAKTCYLRLVLSSLHPTPAAELCCAYAVPPAHADHKAASMQPALQPHSTLDLSLLHPSD